MLVQPMDLSCRIHRVWKLLLCLTWWNKFDEYGTSAFEEVRSLAIEFKMKVVAPSEKYTKKIPEVI
jgi:hypothetical protein